MLTQFPYARLTDFQIANLVEAGFWLVIAICFAAAAFARARPTPTRRRCLIAAIALALFGLSDVVETQTGAWWRPWWLLAWKAGCIVVFLALLLQYLRHRRQSTDGQ